jgi:hypothetical protein
MPALDRDQLARALYVVEPHGPEVELTAAEQRAGAEEWDTGEAGNNDVADCYTRADQLLAVFR